LDFCGTALKRQPSSSIPQHPLKHKLPQPIWS
jgi:hypothetical protein